MIANVKNAFIAPYVGGKLVFNKPKLFKYTLIPVILNILIYLSFIIIAYYIFPSLINYFLFDPKTWYEYTLYYVLVIFTGISIFFILILSFTFVLNILAAPFNEKLCIKVLEHFAYTFDNKNLNVFKEIIRVIVVEIKKILFLLTISIISLLINFFVVLSPISFLLSSFVLAYYYIDYALEVNKYTFRSRLRFALKNIIPITCFGISLGFLMLVPFINLIILPIAISGASFLFNNIIKNNS